MSYESLVLFALAVFVASASPGPNVLIVLTNSFSYGMRGASLTILGNISCLFCIALLAAFGVGSIVSFAPLAYIGMKIAGGIYLGWIGLKLILRTFKKQNLTSELNIERQIADRGSISFFAEAFLVSASNPKSILFLSAVFPQFIDNSKPLATQFLVMFAVMIFIVSCIHSFYALAASKLRTRKISSSIGKWFSRLTGTIFMCLGAAVALGR